MWYIPDVGVSFGLSDFGLGTYKWVDGTDLGYSNWGSVDQTVAGQDRCARFYRNGGWSWAKDSCTKDYYYICEVYIPLSQYRQMMKT